MGRDKAAIGFHCLLCKKIVAYKEFLKHEDTEFESSIRKATSTGRPLETEGLLHLMRVKGGQG